MKINHYLNKKFPCPKCGEMMKLEENQDSKRCGIILENAPKNYYWCKKCKEGTILFF